MGRKKSRSSSANPRTKDPLPSYPSLTYGQVDYIILNTLSESPTGHLEMAPLDFGDDTVKDRLPPTVTINQIRALLREYQLSQQVIMVEYMRDPTPGMQDPVVVAQLRLRPESTDTEDAPKAIKKTDTDIDLPNVPDDNADEDDDAESHASDAPQSNDHGPGAHENTPQATREHVASLPQSPPDLRPVRKKRGGPSVHLERYDEGDMVIPAGLEEIEEQSFILAERTRRGMAEQSQKLLDVMAENTRTMVAGFSQGVRSVLENVGMYDETTRRLRAEIFEMKANHSREQNGLLEMMSRLRIDLEKERAMRFSETDHLRRDIQSRERDILTLQRHIEDAERALKIRRELAVLDRPKEEQDMWSQFLQMGIERFGPRIATLFEDKILSKIMPEPKG